MQEFGCQLGLDSFHNLLGSDDLENAELYQPTCVEKSKLQKVMLTFVDINIFTAFMLVPIPVPMLWHVQINMRVKESLMCIMGLGIFAYFALIMKLSTLPSYGLIGDFLWDTAEITTWTVWVSIIA